MRLDLIDLDDEANLAVAQLLMRWGQEEGAIPADRSDLSGLEQAIFIHDDTIAGRNTVVGGAVFYQPEEDDLVWLDVIFVAEPYRRQGLGRRLVNAVCTAARQAGAARVEFGTINDPMQGLGIACGFQPSVVYMQRPIGKAAS